MDVLPLPKQPTRDWSELPFDALYSIFANLGVVDLLMGAGLVCHSWLEAAKEPDLWRIVHMRHHEIAGMNKNDLWAMLNVAIDRSDGRMEVFVGEWFLTDKLLKYIADRSPNLRHLDLVKCYRITKEGLAEVIPRFPLLEKIVLWGYRRSVTGDLYQLIGKTCNQLECLELCHGSREQTLGIAALHGLRDLALIRCDVNDEELAFVIDSCPLLERLNVRGCFEIAGEPVLMAKRARIKAMSVQIYAHYNWD